MVLERGVVGGRDVPGHVAAEPERQRDEGPGEQADEAEARERAASSGGTEATSEQRDPLRESDVLDQVRPEEVVQRERPERREP